MSTHPTPKDPQAELREAIKKILQPLAASAASKSLGIDRRRAHRLKAERELVKLFQAHQQELIRELGEYCGRLGFKQGIHAFIMQQSKIGELNG